MGMDRVAPKEGYTFGNKAQYRRNIWAQARRYILQQGLSIKHVHAVLMPSLEGKEISVAKANGFQERNLHVVDHNPAIVATLKRSFPKINTYGVDIVKAFERMRDNGVIIRVANLDLCNTVNGSKSRLEIIGRMREPFTDKNLMFVTVQRGREHNFDELSVEHIEKFNFPCRSGDPFRDHPYFLMSEKYDIQVQDCVRLDVVLGSITGPGDDWNWTTAYCKPYVYKSSNNKLTMMYIAMERRLTYEGETLGEQEYNMFGLSGNRIGVRLCSWTKDKDEAIERVNMDYGFANIRGVCATE